MGSPSMVEVLSCQNHQLRREDYSRISVLNQSIGIRSFHSSIARTDNTLILGGAGLLVASVVAQQVFKYYQNKNNAAAPTTSESTKDAQADASKANAQSTTTSSDKTASSSTNTSSGSASSTATPGAAKPGFFASFFARTFYEGGFEPQMTRREAALILGVRESSPVERIKDAHRRILLLNHPDRGGSAFIAAKVNEAKDLLMKGKDGK